MRQAPRKPLRLIQSYLFRIQNTCASIGKSSRHEVILTKGGLRVQEIQFLDVIPRILTEGKAKIVVGESLAAEIATIQKQVPHSPDKTDKR